MKNIKTLLIILTAALFFTACQKEEELKNYDTISGVLTAGENVSSNDFPDINIYLWKLEKEVDLLHINTSIEQKEFIQSGNIGVDGTFAFNDLEKGNFILSLSEGFIFTTDTICLVVVDGATINHLQKTIERASVENRGW